MKMKIKIKIKMKIKMENEIYLAPAKLNLFLHVVGRKANGYHLLQSLFCL